VIFLSMTFAIQYLSTLGLVIRGPVRVARRSINGSGRNRCLNKKHASMTLMLSKLSLLSSQEALLLLRMSLFAPRIIYLFRTTPCFTKKEFLDSLDNLLRDTLESILNLRLTERLFSKATLPISAGGLGVRSASEVALPCYLSSLAASVDMVHQILPCNLHASFSESQSSLQTLLPSNLEPEFDFKSQSEIDKLFWSSRKSSLLESCETVLERAVMLSAEENLGFKWLQVIPNTNTNTALDNTTFRIAVGLRLHADICKNHVCRLCKQVIDSKGVHALSCDFSKGRVPRHAQLNSEICKAFSTIKIPCIREPLGTHPNPNLRPDGASIVPWKNGKFIAWDVTVADTLAPSYRNGTSNRPGYGADIRKRDKFTKYRDLSPQYDFQALGFETMGGLGRGAESIIGELSRQLRDHTAEPRAGDYLLQRLSLIIARSNAVSVLGSLIDDNGYRLDDHPWIA